MKNKNDIYKTKKYKAGAVILIILVLLCSIGFPKPSYADSQEITISTPEESESEVEDSEKDYAKEISTFSLAIAKIGSSSYTTAKAGKYTVLTVESDDDNELYYNCQKALNYAKENATVTNPCKVIIPAGSYNLKASLSIYSNTYLYAKGAYIKNRHGSRMLRNGKTIEAAIEKWTGYSKFKNITIDGGTWNGNGTSKSEQFSNFRFGRVTGLIIKNLKVLNNTGAHHIEIAAAKNVRITNCYFSGYKSGGIKGGKEAIQLDIMLGKDTFRSFGKYDKATCYDIVIKNNVFKNVSRGVGTHSVSSGRYYNNITISNNRFINLKSYAINGLNFRNCVISHNVISNVGSGIYMQSTNNKSTMKYYIHHNNIKVGKMFGGQAFGMRFSGIKSAIIYSNKIISGGKYGIGLVDKSNIRNLKNNIVRRTSNKSAIYIGKGSKSLVKTLKSITIVKVSYKTGIIVGKTQANEIIGLKINNSKIARTKVKKNSKFVIKSNKISKKGEKMTIWFTDKKNNLIKVSKIIK